MGLRAEARNLEFCPKFTVTESSKNIASDEDVYIDDTNMGSKRIWCPCWCHNSDNTEHRPCSLARALALFRPCLLAKLAIMEIAVRLQSMERCR